MKSFVRASSPLVVGYLAGFVFFALSILISGKRVYDWIAIEATAACCTFVVGSALFLPAHFMIRKNSRFWRPWICGPFGAAVGFIIIWLLVGHYAKDPLLWGQAAVIGGMTYLAAGLLRKEGPNQSPEPTSGLPPGRGSP
jgi:hypothetical protein